MKYKIVNADASHYHFSETITKMMEESAKVRGTGIAKREPQYIVKKMEEGKAVIALLDEEVVGFCYMETWDNHEYVANSGLIVHPDHRKSGLAKRIKAKIFELSKKTFPNAKLFGITTSLAVMKINADLGYKPVTFSELTQDDDFWKGCQTCTNYDILKRTDRKMCLCTAMVCDLKEVAEKTADVKVSNKEKWTKFLDFIKNHPFKNINTKQVILFMSKK